MRLTLAIILGTTPLAVEAAPAGNAAQLAKTRCADVLRMAERAPGRIGNGMQSDARFDLHLGMVRTIDRCPVPAILSRDVDRLGTPLRSPR